MRRLTVVIATVLFALTSLILVAPSGQRGRTLSTREQASLFGGQSGYCCGVPTSCQLPSPNPACSTYHTQDSCMGLKKYWTNPPGNNIYACVIVVPTAICVSGSSYNPCLGYYSCIWDTTSGVCYASSTYFITANTSSSCGDSGCT